MSKTFDTLGNDTVDVFFDHLGFQAYGICRGRSNNPFRDYADRDTVFQTAVNSDFDFSSMCAEQHSRPSRPAVVKADHMVRSMPLIPTNKGQAKLLNDDAALDHCSATSSTTPSSC